MFKLWLMRFTDADSPLGDLAQDVAQDAGFPDSDELAILLAHLEDQDACDGALRALRQAHRRWRREHDRGAD